MTAYIHDGVEFDLTRTFVDVVGVEWRWSGNYTPAGEPLLIGAGNTLGLPLPDVYHDHGPLIPMPARQSKRQSLDFARSLQDGHLESYGQYALRTTQVAQ